ncbi:unnamed protein product [Brassica napus]|uniref:(rape) hypothetical protein n=1 Tax=Brassica napus TaxID=3708 RepID=A0A817AXG2_BRANA|nr:unnamed protein product [Brassica napus]
MSQEDDIDVTPLSHCQTDWLGAWGNPFSYPQEMATKQLIVSPVTVSAKSLASLRVSSAKFATLKPGTLKQSQFRSLVVKAASVVAPKYTSIKPLGDRILVKIKEAEEKTMGGILLPSTDWSTNHLLHRYAGTEVEFNDVKHLILKEDDIGLS